MRPHLPEDELHAWLDGQLSSAQRAEIAEHLLACLICRALEAEVRGTRDRATALLAIAVPARRVPQLGAGRRPVIRALRPMAAAAVAAMVIGTSWLLLPNGSSAGPAGGAPRLATAAVAPAILAAITTAPDADLDSTARAEASESRYRRFSLATSAQMTPRVIAPRTMRTAPLAPRPRLDPLAEVTPSVAGVAWQRASFHEARNRAGGLAHLDGMPVTTVRLRPTSNGGRPMAMVRQSLDDGRAVWVVEGTEPEVRDLTRLLEASGLTISPSRRSVPDYIGPADAPRRTVRVVTIASYLPYDSLETLGQRLRLE